MRGREGLVNKVRLIFELHLYNEEMSREEIISLISMYFNNFSILWEGKIGRRKAIEIEIIDSDSKRIEEKIDKIAGRMALIRSMGVVIDEHNKDILNGSEWYVEFRGVKDRKEVLSYFMKLGAELSLRAKEKIVVWKSKGEYRFYVLLKEVREKQFSDREPQNRPGFVPYTLKPRIARALVNIARLKEGKIIDPFCGVGGILIESALLGLSSIGVDIRKENIRKAIENIEYFCKPDVTHFVVGNSLLPFFFKKSKPHFDGLITDLPYGRMSPRKGEGEELAKAIIDYAKLCKRGCRVIVMTNIKNFDDIMRREDREGRLSLYNVFGLRVRKTLTRYVFVFCNLCN